MSGSRRFAGPLCGLAVVSAALALASSAHAQASEPSLAATDGPGTTSEHTVSRKDCLGTARNQSSAAVVAAGSGHRPGSLPNATSTNASIGGDATKVVETWRRTGQAVSG